MVVEVRSPLPPHLAPLADPHVGRHEAAIVRVEHLNDLRLRRPGRSDSGQRPEATTMAAADDQRDRRAVRGSPALPEVLGVDRGDAMERRVLVHLPRVGLRAGRMLST